MPVLHSGKHIVQFNSIYRQTDITELMANLAVSSVTAASTYLAPPTVLDGNKQDFNIPESLVQNIYCLYNFAKRDSSWHKVTNYSMRGTKLTTKEYYNGLLIAFPFDTFEDTFYANGSYEYEMNLTRIDTKIYRNISIAANSLLPCDNINIRFSLSSSGPWLESIFSPFLFSTFYMQININNIEHIRESTTIPSELITLSCLTCE